MRHSITDKRVERIREIAAKRQFDLRLVMENIHDPHNVSAIYRTCDAIGIPKITQIYTVEKFPKLKNSSSSSASKWIETEKFDSYQEMVNSLKNESYEIISSCLDEKAESIFEVDFTKKIAIVVGNEHRGISDEMRELSDKLIYIPMYGMVQSLNVSVATAVILYEVLRQRLVSKMYENNKIEEEELEKIVLKWRKK